MTVSKLFSGLSDLIQSRNSGNVIQPVSVDPRITKERFHFSDPDFQQGKISISSSKMKIEKLEENVASLLENVASDKIQVSAEIKEIRSSVALVKSGLGAEIDRLAVSDIWFGIYLLWPIIYGSYIGG